MGKENNFEDEHKTGIRIVDRRRFDSSGEEKVEPSVVVEKVKQSAAPANPEQKIESNSSEFIMKEADKSQDHFDDQSDISFGSFVLSLATQALMQLGQLQAPDGMSIPVDPAAAKQTIDILGMLQAKTKGNLDAKEEGLLRDALQSLRLAFVKV